MLFSKPEHEADHQVDNKYSDYLRRVALRELPPPSPLNQESRNGLYNFLRNFKTLCEEFKIAWWVTNNTWLALARGHGGLLPWDTVVTVATTEEGFKTLGSDSVTQCYRDRFGWGQRKKPHFGCKFFVQGGSTEEGKREVPHCDVFVVRVGGTDPYAKFAMACKNGGWARHVHPTEADLFPLRKLACLDFEVPAPNKTTALTLHYPDYETKVVTGAFNHLQAAWVPKSQIREFEITSGYCKGLRMPFTAAEKTGVPNKKRRSGAGEADALTARKEELRSSGVDPDQVPLLSDQASYPCLDVEVGQECKDCKTKVFETTDELNIHSDDPPSAALFRHKDRREEPVNPAELEALFNSLSIGTPKDSPLPPPEESPWELLKTTSGVVGTETARIDPVEYTAWLEREYPCMAPYLPGTRSLFNRDWKRFVMFVDYLECLAAGECWRKKRYGKCAGDPETHACYVCNQLEDTVSQKRADQKQVTKALAKFKKVLKGTELWELPFHVRHAILMYTRDSQAHFDTGSDIFVQDLWEAVTDTALPDWIERDAPQQIEPQDTRNRPMFAWGRVFSTKYFLFVPWPHLTPLQRFRVTEWLEVCYYDNLALGRYNLPDSPLLTSPTALYTLNIIQGLAPFPFRGENHLLNPTLAQLSLWQKITGLPPLHVHEAHNGDAYYIGANVLHAVGNDPACPLAVSVAFDGFTWCDHAQAIRRGELVTAHCADVCLAVGKRANE